MTVLYFLQRNVSWVLTPHSGCSKKDTVVMMISSGPANTRLREEWRARAEVGTVSSYGVI